MRKMLALLGVGAVFAGGLLLGVTQFQRTTTKTVLVVSTTEVEAQEESATMHVVMLDGEPYDQVTGEATSDCSQAARLAVLPTVELRAPGNGLTSGELLGLPDEASAIYAPNVDGYGCQLSFDIPDVVWSSFYSLQLQKPGGGTVGKTYSRAELEREDWTVTLNVVVQSQ